MALAANTQRVTKERNVWTFQIVNSEVIYAGSFLGVNDANHGTSGDRGRVEPYTAEDNQVPVGAFAKASDFAIDSTGLTGDTSATPIPYCAADLLPQILDGSGATNGIAVTGVTGVTDVLKPVFMTDDNTFTLTRQTRGCPVGVVIEYVTTGYAKILLFGLLGQLMVGYSGNQQTTLHMGRFVPGQLLASSFASGTVIARQEAPFHGKIIKLQTTVDGPLGGAGGNAGVEAFINSTAVTGARVQVAVSTAIGTSASGVASAEHIFHEGDALSARLGGTIAGTWASGAAANGGSGGVNVFIQVEKLPGH